MAWRESKAHFPGQVRMSRTYFSKPLAAPQCFYTCASKEVTQLIDSGGKNFPERTCVLEDKAASGTEIYNPRKDSCKHIPYFSQKEKTKTKTKKQKNSRCTVKEEFFCLASEFPWNGRVPRGLWSCWKCLG